MRVFFISHRTTLLLATLLTTCLMSTTLKGQTPNEQDRKSIFLADPTIFYHDGTYYLYGTGGHDSNKGFMVYTSTDLKQWEGPKGVNDGYALSKEDVYGDKGFWAPQVFRHDGKFYMAYTANEHIAIATSDSPLGPFVQHEKKSITAGVKNIDPYVFFDEDGKIYLYHVRLQEGNRIFVAEMTDDLSDIKPNTLKECISAVNSPQAWEDTQHAAWTVTEGPTVLKHPAASTVDTVRRAGEPQGLYYLFYSANDFRNPDYAVGYATADNPMGPWKKYAGNPILSAKITGERGSGHGDFFTDEDGDLQYVFHTHFGKDKVSPRRTAIIKGTFTNSGNKTADIMVFDQRTFRFLHPKNK